MESSSLLFQFIPAFQCARAFLPRSLPPPLTISRSFHSPTPRCSRKRLNQRLPIDRWRAVLFHYFLKWRHNGGEPAEPRLRDIKSVNASNNKAIWSIGFQSNSNTAIATSYSNFADIAGGQDVFDLTTPKSCPPLRLIRARPPRRLPLRGVVLQR
jgi:hypothetical protein